MIYTELFEKLNCARREHNAKAVLNYGDVLSFIKTAALNEGHRDEFPDDFVNKCLLKIKKMAEETVATCPVERQDLMPTYKENLDFITKLAPNTISDPEEIKKVINSFGIECIPKNMKQIMSKLKTCGLMIDMKVASAVIRGTYGN